MYQVVKRDGRIVDFDISKISAAIQKAFEAVHAIDREIKERRRELKSYCKREVQKLNARLRNAWIARNRGAGRSNTSAVSDKMLLTIPTPPTAEAANRSLWQRGMADGAVA